MHTAYHWNRHLKALIKCGMGSRETGTAYEWEGDAEGVHSDCTTFGSADSELAIPLKYSLMKDPTIRNKNSGNRRSEGEFKLLTVPTSANGM
jgi:hypothetical protein